MPSLAPSALPNAKFARLRRLAGQFFVIAKKRGVGVALRMALMRAFLIKGELANSKEKVLRHLQGLHGSMVAYGPFKGMRLSQNIWWGRYDQITKILGVYEHHVLQRLFEFPRSDEVAFIDIGAADGYFAVGAAVSGLSNAIYAYEISAQGRLSLADNAKINDCSDKITIYPEATFDTLSQVIRKHDHAIILLDIEGSEFDLLDDRLLSTLSRCHIVVELHPLAVENGRERQELLLNSARRYFATELIERDCYNPNCFTELRMFSDDERLLAMSEGRRSNMQWLVMSPRVDSR